MPNKNIATVIKSWPAHSANSNHLLCSR